MGRPHCAQLGTGRSSGTGRQPSSEKAGARVEVRGPSTPRDARTVGSRYAASPPPASRSFGQGPKCLRGLLGDTRERDEARRNQHGFFDRRVRILLEEAQEPARGDPLVPARILARDEHGEFERVDETQLREILGRGQRREHVPALQCPLEDRVRVALRGRRSSSLGARRTAQQP
jgi:hypothetical protein